MPPRPRRCRHRCPKLTPLGAAADLPAGSSDKLLAHDAVARATNDTTKILFVDHVEGDGKKDHRQAPAKELTTIECVDRYASHVDDKPGMSTCSVFLYSASSCSAHKTVLLIWSPYASRIQSIEKVCFHMLPGFSR